MSDYGRKPRRKYCQFCKDHAEYIDYKDSQMLRKYMTDRGKIKPRRVLETARSISTDSRWQSSAPARWRYCPMPCRSSVVASAARADRPMKSFPKEYS